MYVLRPKYSGDSRVPPINKLRRVLHGLRVLFVLCSYYNQLGLHRRRCKHRGLSFYYGKKQNHAHKRTYIFFVDRTVVKTAVVWPPASKRNERQGLTLHLFPISDRLVSYYCGADFYFSYSHFLVLGASRDVACFLVAWYRSCRPRCSRPLLLSKFPWFLAFRCICLAFVKYKTAAHTPPHTHRGGERVGISLQNRRFFLFALFSLLHFVSHLLQRPLPSASCWVFDLILLDSEMKRNEPTLSLSLGRSPRTNQQAVDSSLDI